MCKILLRYLNRFYRMRFDRLVSDIDILFIFRTMRLISHSACQCTTANMALLTTDVTPCVISACDSADIPTVLSAANAVCSCANSGPVGGTCSSTTASGGSSAGTKSQSSTQTYSSSPTSTSSCSAGTAPDCSSEAAAIPSCALSCFETSIASIGCGITD
jgi:hypothetical protein